MNIMLTNLDSVEQIEFSTDGNEIYITITEKTTEIEVKPIPTTFGFGI